MNKSKAYQAYTVYAYELTAGAKTAVLHAVGETGQLVQLTMGRGPAELYVAAIDAGLQPKIGMEFAPKAKRKGES